MRKENLEDFLKHLTDKELAFFYRFRSKEFMPNSRDKILSELNRRNLTETQIDEMTEQAEQMSPGNCPRCGSSRLVEVKDTELRATKYGGYEVEINSRKCRICSYNAEKDQPINWKVRLDRFFGKFSWIKLK
ncbi:hypothetical protein [Flagellimonas oceanensis]|uniref:hypothetical protein n=1 Tax=Flagellimonas oceanensis TaxID=2499163 RepID=UPI003BAC1962